MRIILYLGSIIIANILTAALQPANVLGLIIPAGSWLVGITFIFRDLTQLQIGRKKTYAVIALAMSISGVLSLFLGDGLQIVLASMAAFVVSEAIDTEIFSRLQASIRKRVILSGIFGSAADTVIFIILGIGPMGMGFITWGQVPAAIAGQLLVKMAMQLLGAGLIRK